MPQELSDAMKLDASLKALTEQVSVLKGALNSVLSGADELIDGLLLCLVAGGHGLIEGPPGVGKTIAVKALSASLGLTLTRVQMTPDLMPSDLIGSTIISEVEGRAPVLTFKEGPIFTELLFADELNRANPRTQAALLEAMAERQVTVDGETRQLSSVFLVFATQNPVEVEGTFALPAAQADRFLCRLFVPLPSADTLRELLSTNPSQHLKALTPLVQRASLSEWPVVAQQVVVPDRLLERLIQLIMLTRPDRAPGDLSAKIAAGVSPRAAQDLLGAVKARAAMAGRPYARVEDLEKSAIPVLAHRLTLTWEARADGASPEALISELVALSGRPKRV